MRRGRTLNEESKDLGPCLVCGQVTFPFFACFLFCKMRVLGWTAFLILVTSPGSGAIQALPHSSGVDLGKGLHLFISSPVKQDQ